MLLNYFGENGDFSYEDMKNMYYIFISLHGYLTIKIYKNWISDWKSEL